MSLRSPLGVILKWDSADAKLVRNDRNPLARNHCAATYRTIRYTCRPDECDLHPDNGGICYAAHGQVAFTNRRLEAMADIFDPPALAITREEARLILEYAEAQPRRTGLDLRLGVSGEVSGPLGAADLAWAGGQWAQNVGGRVWTYTHAWKRILRERWGIVSALASIDDWKDIAKAKRRGYVPAIVRKRHTSTKAFQVDEDPTGTRFIPCLHETMGIPCVECRLCLDDHSLRSRNYGIAFQSDKKKRHLPLVKG